MNEKPKFRICMMSLLFFPHYSGAGAQMLALSKALAARGASIIFVAGRFEDEPEFEEYEEFQVYRVRIALQSLLGLVGFWFRLFVLLFRLRGEFDLIHVHGVGIHQIMIGLFGKILRRKTVIKITMAKVDLNFMNTGRIIGRLEHWAFRYFAKIISLSSEIRAELTILGIPDHMVVSMPNGVNTDRFHPVTPIEKGRSKSKLQLSHGKIATFIGQISRRKGIDVLIKAWKGVIAECPEARLLIIGPIADRDMYCPDHTFIETITRLIDDYKMQDHVAILGERQDVELYLQASDVFVLPSQTEGMPNVLLEAMACGLPCLTTRVSGTQDVIMDGKNGFLVDYGDSEALRVRLVQLLNDGDLRDNIGASALRTIKEKFSLGMIADSYVRVYADLLWLRS
jgi:glycosyltransferase involved in cell wall biosynthesis